MIKQVSVTFEFDPETELVSNLKCFIDGVEKKKTTTSKAKKEKDVVIEDQSVITLEANKISFNNKAVLDMELKYQDRIIIKYEKIKGQKKPLPIIGKDTSFDEEGSGNKLTKTNTIAYRGNANTILAEYGSKFTIEEYSEGIWKLVSLDDTSINISKDDTYEDVIAKAEDIELTVFTESDEDTEINEMTFKL